MIHILLFAHLQEQFGKEELSLPDEEITAAELKKKLEREHPGLQLQQVMVAVNEELVAPTAIIKHGDTVALLPPVSGG